VEEVRLGWRKELVVDEVKVEAALRIRIRSYVFSDPDPTLMSTRKLTGRENLTSYALLLFRYHSGTLSP
jgi:hypothetical protein